MLRYLTNKNNPSVFKQCVEVSYDEKWINHLGRVQVYLHNGKFVQVVIDDIKITLGW